MALKFRGKANVGTTPTLKIIDTDGGQRPVCEFRACFDEFRPDEQDNFTKVAETWLTISVWGDLAKRVVRHISVGARIEVSGRLRGFSYEKDGETHYGMNAIAEDVYPVLSRVDEIKWRSKNSASDGVEGEDDHES